MSNDVIILAIVLNLNLSFIVLPHCLIKISSLQSNIAGRRSQKVFSNLSSGSLCLQYLYLITWLGYNHIIPF